MTPEIFICASEADGAHAAALRRALVQDLGRSVFGLLPGDLTDIETQRALQHVAVMAVIVDRRWADDEMEAREALATALWDTTSRCRVVPIHVGPHRPADLPHGLRSLCAIADAGRDWSRVGRCLADLLDGTYTGHPVPGDLMKPRLALSRMPQVGEVCIGRRSELALLDDAWRDPRVALVSIVAWGGVGKTTLVAHWLRAMAAHGYEGAEQVFVWSFYSQGAVAGSQASASVFLDTLLRWLGDPNPAAGDAWARGQRAAERLQKHKTLLVLDGLEPMQYPPGPAMGKLMDRSLHALLSALTMTLDGLCVVTTRYRLPGFEAGEGRGRVVGYALGPLADEHGAALMLRLGVRGLDVDLRRASCEFDGHALALRLLASYLVRYSDGDILCREQISGLTDTEDEGGHANRVLEAYVRRLDGVELEVLDCVGLFDRPVSWALLGELAASGAVDLFSRLVDDGHPLDALGRSRPVLKLLEAGLLTEHGDPTLLDAHPLIREFFGRRVQRELPDRWTAAHMWLYRHYASIIEGRAPPRDLSEMEPYFRAMYHACMAEAFSYALGTYMALELTSAATPSQLGAHWAVINALGHLFSVHWTEYRPGFHPVERVSLLGDVGRALLAVGRLREATEALSRAVAIARVEAADGPLLVIADLALARCLLETGRLTARRGPERGSAQPGALDYAEGALTDIERLDQPREERETWMLEALVLRACALHRLGRMKDACAAFADAERLSVKMVMREAKPETMSEHRFVARAGRLSGLAASAHIEFLIDSGDHHGARERAAFLLEHAPPTSSEFERGLYHLRFGQVLYERARTHLIADPELGSAGHHIETGLDLLRRAGRMSDVPNALLVGARHHAYVHAWEDAEALLTEARAMADAYGLALVRIDADIEAIRFALIRGERDTAGPLLAVVETDIERLAYHARAGLVADLRARLEGAATARSASTHERAPRAELAHGEAAERDDSLAAVGVVSGVIVVSALLSFITQCGPC